MDPPPGIPSLVSNNTGGVLGLPLDHALYTAQNEGHTTRIGHDTLGAQVTVAATPESMGAHSTPTAGASITQPPTTLGIQATVVGNQAFVRGPQPTYVVGNSGPSTSATPQQPVMFFYGQPTGLAPTTATAFSKTPSHGQPEPNHHTRTMATSQLAAELKHTLHAALAPSTHKTYEKVEVRLQEFTSETGLVSFPADQQVTAMFIQFLTRRYKPSTIKTYTSALSHKYKMAGYSDPTNSYLVRQALKGISKLTPTGDTRKPITLPLLQRLMSIAPTITENEYQAIMLKAMYATAFFGLLRISEFTFGDKGQDHTIHLKNVTVDLSKSFITIVLTSFKHCRGSSQYRITLNKQTLDICPVHHLQAYLLIRPQVTNPHLFVNERGLTITRSQFGYLLRNSLKALGITSSDIKSHSFRIGGATLAAQSGMSTQQIQMLGRWRSDAFKTYLRP
ncbi:uncharacterized protein LOC106173936 isoform X2 [Lingula anatina]|nr:uncharacterized protein LOC106173936 isoform X2 [Lingula anatina]|eukprot:XP_013410733.1 uncharacterized protein LOC106173936 isoform X2 [Lingula anatina]